MKTSTGSYTFPPYSIAILSPWGVDPGYSGPKTLLNRLMEVIAQEESVNKLHFVSRRSDANAGAPAWSTTSHLPLIAGQLSWRRTIRWAVSAARHQWRIRRDYEVTYAHGAYAANLLAILMGPSKPTVVLPVLENGDLRLPSRQPARMAKSLLFFLLRRRSVVCLALSAGIANESSRIVSTQQRVLPIGNLGVAAGFPHERSATELRIGFVGRLGQQKRPDLVVAAMRELAGRGYHVKGTLVGPFESQEWEVRLQRLAAGLNCAFPGWQEDVIPFLKDFDYFVLPSESEGFPGALAEAMLQGIPALVTDVGGMAQAILESGGGKVVEARVDSIVDAILSLSTESAWARASAAAYEYACSRYTPKAGAAIVLDAVALACSKEDQ